MSHTLQLPFGGIGHTGIGSYHGKYGFATCSHQHSIMHRSAAREWFASFSPYGNQLTLIRRFLRWLGRE
jgi:aldehyde dehydrogenase (NAD+)